MFLSKLTYDMPSAYDYLNSNITSYSLHQDMWRFFPGRQNSAIGPFLYAVQGEKILMVSSVEPVSPDSLWTLQTRFYNPLMDQDQELFYELTFNPSYAKNGKKCSYIGNNMKTPGKEFGSRKEQAQELLVEWFKKRADKFGFDLVSLEIIKDINRKIPKPGTPYTFDEFTVRGVLKVTNVDNLKHTIFTGVGREKEMDADLSFYHKHPQFDINKNKIRARETLINFYFELTGKKSIPKGGQYWTLCSDQSNMPGSEIEQLCQANFLNKSQFYGVDISAKKITLNKQRHSEAHWFQGEWTDVIQSNLRMYNPSVVYLDSCSVLEGYPIIDLMTSTLEYTSSGVVFVNMMKNNPHSGETFSVKNFLKALKDNMSFTMRRNWDLQKKEYIYSSSDKTIMNTLIFTRQV